MVEFRLVIGSCCFNFLENIGASEEVKGLITVDIIGKRNAVVQPRVLQLNLDNVYQLSQHKYQKRTKSKNVPAQELNP